MKIRITRLLPAAVLGAGLLLTACGTDSKLFGTATIDPAAAAATATAKPAAAATIALADTDLGTVLTGAEGLTLYGFTDDTAGTPTCVDSCLTAWPAFTVEGTFTAPAGFDQSEFTVVDRPDGGKQLKFGTWPLYYYAGDGAPGDTLGQGIGGKWFVLDAEATLVKPDEAAAATGEAAAAPAVATAQLGAFGTALVAANGMTLYGFTDDANGTPTCADSCAKAWPALSADAGTVAGTGLDQTQLTVVDRPDGGKQLKYGKWPLYFYAGDGAPGDTIGQGVGTKWFVIATDGTLIKGDAAVSTQAPAAEPAPAPAPEPAPAAAPAGPVVDLATVGNLGEVMVGANGHTLYAFTDDTQTSTACVDECAAAWPPLTVEPGFTISDELNQAGVSTLTRPDGSIQLVMGQWPLYYYAGDGQPGDALGQGIGTKWYAVSAACKLVKTAA